MADLKSTLVKGNLRVTEDIYKGSEKILPVSATPSGSPTDDLSKIKIGDTIYGINGTSIISTTYANLKDLRDDGELIPGQLYRITDYICTTTAINTSSAGHVFDIIVRADNYETLNEEARAIRHESDTYFTNNNLPTWKLWYCLDNDTERFDWADTTNGKGVIYRMIDEFNNDCPYDFKNILFKASVQADYQWVASGGTSLWVYTFNAFNSEDGEDIEDASVISYQTEADDQDYWALIVCTNNKIEPYFDNVSQSSPVEHQHLPYNIFLNTYNPGDYIGSFCSNNILRGGSSNNIFNNNCFNNTFEQQCHNNKLDSNCYQNSFGQGCYENTLLSGSYDNTFKQICFSNNLGASNRYNTFNAYCRYINTGSYLLNSTFGANCIDLYFTTSNYSQNIKVGAGCEHLHIYSVDGVESSGNQMQNIYIASGIKGSSSSSRKTIAIPDRNLKYETEVYQDSSGNIILKENNGTPILDLRP